MHESRTDHRVLNKYYRTGIRSSRAVFVHTIDDNEQHVYLSLCLGISTQMSDT